MSGRSTAPEKRPGFFKQLRTLYTFTQKSFRWLPWLLAGIFVLSIGVGVAVGLPHSSRSPGGASCCGRSRA